MRQLGLPVKEIVVLQGVVERYRHWWAVGFNGDLSQWDGRESQLIKMIRQADGSTFETPGDGAWLTGAGGKKYFRDMDNDNVFPTILLSMIIISAIGPSTYNVVIAIALGGAPGIAGLVRALATNIRPCEVVSAAKLRGVSNLQIVLREILPNFRVLLIVDFLMRIGYSAFYIGRLGFLGLCLMPPTPDRGGMVLKGRDRMRTYNLLSPARARARAG